MKTLGSIYVRRKLAYFHSVFPHDDKTTVKNITDIYDDVLEYSRSVDQIAQFTFLSSSSLSDATFIPNL